MEQNHITSIEDFYNLITDKFLTFSDGFYSILPNLLLAIVVYFLFLLIARLIRKGIKRTLNRLNIHSSLSALFVSVVYISVLVIGVFTALEILKLDKAVTSLLAGVGIIGLALSFAFQDIASNLMSGIIISVKKPIEIGDCVLIDGHEGHVIQMDFRVTQIQSYQGQIIFVPNKTIINTSIMNYTRSGTRRVDIPIGVSYDSDLELVKTVTLQTVDKLANLDNERNSGLVFLDFGESAINFVVVFWIKPTDIGTFLEARSQAIIAITQAYRENNIEIPFPICTFDLGTKNGESFRKMFTN